MWWTCGREQSKGEQGIAGCSGVDQPKMVTYCFAHVWERRILDEPGRCTCTHLVTVTACSLYCTHTSALFMDLEPSCFVCCVSQSVTLCVLMYCVSSQLCFHFVYVVTPPTSFQLTPGYNNIINNSNNNNDNNNYSSS